MGSSQPGAGHDGGVRRTLLLVAAWAAAGATAVALATAAVSMVGNQVTGSRPSPLSADQVRRELDAGGGGASRSTTSTTTTPAGSGPDVAPEPESSSARSPASTETTRTVRPAPTPSPTTTTTRPAAPSETRTYNLVGGTATLRFSESGVKVVVASPNAGFSVEVEPTHDNGVKVEFRSERHRSRVAGWWDGGARDEVEEDEED